MELKFSCPECGSMSIHFPDQDDEQVTCNQCHAPLGTKRSADKAIREATKQAGDDFLDRNAPSGGGWSKH